jgi:hypothetical protein
MTTTVTVTLSEFARRVRTLGPRMRRHTVRGLRTGAKRLGAAVAEAIAETRPFVPVDTGVYAAAFEIERLSNGARVENRALHAQDIEIGRRPGPVPLAPILAWVKRKRLYENELRDVLADRRESHRMERANLRGIVRGTEAERGEMNALRRRQRRDAIEEAAKRVAFRIRRKIAREGYAPRFPVRRGLQASAREIELAILAALDEIEP